MRVLGFLSAALLAVSVSAATPKMSISAPHGGEAYVAGQPQNLVYNGKTKFKSLLVEVSRDGGETWKVVGTINNKVKDVSKRNVFTWVVEGPSSARCKIRMTGEMGGGKKKKKVSVESGLFALATGTGDDGELFTGPTGATGAVGDKGLIGDKGDKGDVGATGAQGPQGDKGDVGAKGDKGDTGATGAKGDQGDKGDIGSTGPAGVDGIQGVAGPQGPQGAQGPKGDQGDKGDKGDQGIAGVDGKDGAAGAAGAQGPQGDKGDKGDVGAAGAQGAQGPKGDQGDVGPAGAAGVAGAQGPKGDKGDTGATGAQGVAGPAGPAGPTGPQGPAGAAGPTGPNGSPTVSYINNASTANAVLTSSKHDGTLVINDPNIRGPGHIKGRSQIFFSFSTASAAGVGGVVSLSGAGLQDGQITVIITTQNYAIKLTDSVDYQIVNQQ